MPHPALCPGHASPRAFPSIGRLPSTTSAAADQTALFGASQVLCKPSDSSPLPRQLRLLGFPPWPGTALAIAGETRSPRFRRVPFARDVFSDPGRANDASHNGIAHVAFDPFHGLRPCGKPISWLNSTPHAIAVYASRTHYRAACYGLTRTGLPPAGSRQLRLAHRKREVKGSQLRNTLNNLLE